MSSFCKISCAAVSLFLAITAHGAMTADQLKTLPPPAAHAIDFKKEVQPIFEESCIRCHGRGRDKGGLQIDSKETLLKGGDSGPAVVAGHSADSYLISLVAGFDPDAIMPKKGRKLTPEQIGVLRAWIDQGMPWDPAIQFGPVATRNLLPRNPAIPSGKSSNPVDRFMDVYFAQHHIKPAAPVSDRVYARRVWLDTIGLLPTPAELDAFESNHKTGKREQLVASLLSRNDAYAEKWLSFWNDLLRNDYKGTGYIDGGRKQITRWLYSALLTNMPYDQFVAELINPTPDSVGFTQGIIWRGVVNASQKPQMQAAQNVSQVFVGVNLKCASCHDSFINDWQLSDSYGLANIYSDAPQEIYECDKPTGRKAPTKFLFPELGEVAATTNKQTRLKELATVMTCPKDGRLTRTMVNRLWAHFMGRGLVESVDDMQQPAWNQDLLDWLSEDLAAHHYDVKQTIARILTSRAYQMPAVDPGEVKQTFVFTGPEVRRMTAEEFRDALAELTSIGYATSDADVGPADSTKKKFGPKRAAKWIWNDPQAAAKAKAGSVYARKTVKLSTVPTEATALVMCDNNFEFFVNGHKAGEGNDFSKPFLLDMKPWLRKGENVIAVHAVNQLPNGQQPTPDKIVPGTENPAGLFVYARVRGQGRTNEAVMDFISDKSWSVTENPETNWEQPGFVMADWKPASELGGISIAPWNASSDTIANQFHSRVLGEKPGEVRASMVAADSLQTALGRPNRDQVVTTRATTATTLQALELTNGKNLSDILHRGAAAIVKQNATPRQLVTNVFQEAVGRKPSREELKVAESLLSKKPKPSEVEDLLWAVVMLPEFQLIY